MLAITVDYYVDDVMLFAMLLDILIESLEALSKKDLPLGFNIRWAKTKPQSDFPPPPSQVIDINTARGKR